MRIGLITIDSRGGVQPLIALALELRRAGHDVVFVQPSDTSDMVAAHGLAARPLSVNVREFLEGRGESLGGRRADLLAARRSLPGRLATWMREARDALQGVDVIVSGTTALMVARPIAAAFEVPLVEAHLQPIGPATTEFPGMLFPDPPRVLRPAGNVIGHLATNAMLTLPIRAAVRRASVQVLGAHESRRRIPGMSLYGYSPSVVPKPRSWGPERHVTGYWTLTEPGWTAPPALRAFLAAGPPPVCVGFGSMPVPDPAALGGVVAEAAQRVGARLLVLGGWGGLTASGPSDDVLVLRSAPHDQMFPRVAAVIHHGGAGTTGAAVSAGVPSVVVPWGADQPLWAARLRALGVAGDPVPRARLDAAVLTTALRRVLTDTSLRMRATRLAEAVRTDRGVQSAAALIEAAGGGPGSAPPSGPA